MANSTVTVHRFQATLFPVNAYLVETATALVAVDATLGVSDGRALRARAAQIGKPLAGIIVTHAHPDHYGAVGTLVGTWDVPVYAVRGVDDVIRRDDAEKDRILGPMFGDEWPATRMFPTHPVADGDRVAVDGATFRAVDVGPAESPHDSWWVLESDGPPRIFAGDLVYNHMHAYLADGFCDEWLQALQRAKRELPAETRLFIGHGDSPTGLDIVGWQIGYMEAFLGALRTGEQDGLVGDALVEAVARRMKSYLPSDDLEFLMRLSVEPVRRGNTREADV